MLLSTYFESVYGGFALQFSNMGNATARDKGRHSSGEDSGPTMAVRDFMSGSLDEAEEYMQGPTVSTLYCGTFSFSSLTFL